MGKLLLAALIFFTGFTALSKPWIGIVSYYLLSILGPQYIWWWNFEGLRVSLLVAVFTFSGVAFQLHNKNYDFKFLTSTQNFWLAVLWFCVSVSYLFGPYVDAFASSGLRPDQLFSLTNTIFLFYFCAVLELNDLRKLRYLVLIFVGSTIYLTYWSNDQYLAQNWNQFNMGRLAGPSSLDGGSIYSDENAFAMLFVTGVPFIFYLGCELQRKWLRWLLWGTIPLAWHSVFLTGSRGGLIGLGTVVMLTVFLSNRKILAAPLLVVFFFFYQWQSGDVMRERSDTIANYEGENSAGDRLTAWQGGLKMIQMHPIMGVGLGSFVTALPLYHDSRPMVAHNTFIQFAAESGLGAGAAYVAIVVLFFINSRKIRRWCREHDDVQEADQIGRYNDSSTVSFAGMIVCSTFLSLNTCEIFFILLIFNNALVQICLRKGKPAVVLSSA